MKRPRYVLIDGKRVLWSELLDQRRAQLAETKQGEQPTLFELRDDSRPATAKRAADRFRQPGLFDD